LTAYLAPLNDNNEIKKGTMNAYMVACSYNWKKDLSIRICEIIAVGTTIEANMKEVPDADLVSNPP